MVHLRAIKAIEMAGRSTRLQLVLAKNYDGPKNMVEPKLFQVMRRARDVASKRCGCCARPVL
jgi:hypothetical protein